MKNLAQSFPGVYVRYHQGFEALAFELEGAKPKRPPFNVWIYGPTGTGKTREAFARADSDVYIATCEGKFWLNYRN